MTLIDYQLCVINTGLNYMQTVILIKGLLICFEQKQHYSLAQSKHGI